MGTEVSETWQPGVIKSKINTRHTYLADTNFWSPLGNDEEDEVEEDEKEKIYVIKSIETPKQKSNKWMRRIARR